MCLVNRFVIAIFAIAGKILRYLWNRGRIFPDFTSKVKFLQANNLQPQK